MREHFAFHGSAYVRLIPRARGLTELGKCRHVGGLAKRDVKKLPENFNSVVFLNSRRKPTNSRQAGTMNIATKVKGSPPSGMLGELAGAWSWLTARACSVVSETIVVSASAAIPIMVPSAMMWLDADVEVARMHSEWKIGAKPARRATMVTTIHLYAWWLFNTFQIYCYFLRNTFEHLTYCFGFAQLLTVQIGLIF